MKCNNDNNRGKITDIAICENSHSVASASDLGSIHVFRIEYTKKVRSCRLSRTRRINLYALRYIFRKEATTGTREYRL